MKAHFLSFERPMFSKPTKPVMNSRRKAPWNQLLMTSMMMMIANKLPSRLKQSKKKEDLLMLHWVELEKICIWGLILSSSFFFLLSNHVFLFHLSLLLPAGFFPSISHVIVLHPLRFSHWWFACFIVCIAVVLCMICLELLKCLRAFWVRFPVNWFKMRRWMQQQQTQDRNFHPHHKSVEWVLELLPHGIARFPSHDRIGCNWLPWVPLLHLLFHHPHPHHLPLPPLLLLQCRSLPLLRLWFFLPFLFGRQPFLFQTHRPVAIAAVHCLLSHPHPPFHPPPPFLPSLWVPLPLIGR